MWSGMVILRVYRFMTKVYMRHIRQCRFCSTGFIIFCKDRGLDYKTFFKQGIEIRELKKLMKGEKHTLVERAIKLAEKKGK